MIVRMRQRWDRSRVIAILKGLRDDKGISVTQMAAMAGVSQPQTVYRWMGEGGVPAPQPSRIPVQDLAWAILPRYPELARDLVRAAGHPWEDPPELPPEPLVAPELAASLRRYAPDEADEIIAELERVRAARRAAPPDSQAAC
jgi:predicted DNA-binding transcriptional regulator AlpA